MHWHMEPATHKRERWPSHQSSGPGHLRDRTSHMRDGPSHQNDGQATQVLDKPHEIDFIICPDGITIITTTTTIAAVHSNYSEGLEKTLGHASTGHRQLNHSTTSPQIDLSPTQRSTTPPDAAEGLETNRKPGHHCSPCSQMPAGRDQEWEEQTRCPV